VDCVTTVRENIDDTVDPLEALRTFLYTVGEQQQTDRGLRDGSRRPLLEPDLSGRGADNGPLHGGRPRDELPLPFPMVIPT
jgi:hypothetical protein